MYFKYTEQDLAELCKKDALLEARIQEIGLIQRELTPDLFEALIAAVVSQQIAKKAYLTVWGKLKILLGDEITPMGILAADRQAIKDCGLSFKKTDWIIEIARSVQTGKTDLSKLNGMSEGELIRALVKLPGIGLWTAEMLMIFALNRMDILSFGDFAIRKGMMRLYGLENLDKPTFLQIKGKLSPYNSIASLYFWEIAAEETGK